jgi:hypothetical protein
MSLQVNVNIVKGWPDSTIIEKSLSSGSGVGALAQGDIVRVGTDGVTWVKGINTKYQIPFIVMVDSADPSANRGSTDTTSYLQVAFGAIHGIGLNNALEIETTNYTPATYTVGAALSAPAGLLKIAVTGEVVVGTVSKAPYSLGSKTYLTFIPVVGASTFA